MKRSLNTLEGVTISPEEATKVLFGAVNQLVFLVEKLIEERANTQKPT